MLDRTTKALLGIIAFALLALAAENAAPPARAQSSGACGNEAQHPCYIQVEGQVDAQVMRY